MNLNYSSFDAMLHNRGISKPKVSHPQLKPKRGRHLTRVKAKKSKGVKTCQPLSINKTQVHSESAKSKRVRGDSQDKHSSKDYSNAALSLGTTGHKMRTIQHLEAHPKKPRKVVSDSDSYSFGTDQNEYHDNYFERLAAVPRHH
jgi:hypothetical protein